MARRFFDPRAISADYDFRFFGAGTPTDQAKAALASALRCEARSPGHFRNDIARANRMMWAAKNQSMIQAATMLPAHQVWAIQQGARVSIKTGVE